MQKSAKSAVCSFKACHVRQLMINLLPESVLQNLATAWVVEKEKPLSLKGGCVSLLLTRAPEDDKWQIQMSVPCCACADNRIQGNALLVAFLPCHRGTSVGSSPAAMAVSGLCGWHPAFSLLPCARSVPPGGFSSASSPWPSGAAQPLLRRSAVVSTFQHQSRWKVLSTKETALHHSLCCVSDLSSNCSSLLGNLDSWITPLEHCFHSWI